MLQTLPTRAVEVFANEPVFTPVSADGDRCSNEMCATPIELMLDVMSEIFDPKRKRRRVKKRPPLPCFIIRATSRAREHRAASRRAGGARADSSDDGGGGSDPPPRRLKSEHGQRAEVTKPQSQPRSRAPRVQHGRAPR